MQLDGHATNQDLATLIDKLCDTTDTSFPLEEKVLYINPGLQELVGELVVIDGKFEYDDTNYTDLPIGTGTLVDGQTQYTFSAEYLRVLGIHILNDDGTRYRKIKPLDISEMNGLSPDEFFGVDSSGNPLKGIPTHYDLLGDSIFLYPAPDTTQVTAAAGLKIYFQRDADLFTTSDTTQEPGLPSSYHSILAYMAAIPYCMKYHKDRVVLYQNKVAEMKENLLKFFGKRHEDDRHIMRIKPINYR